MLVVGVLILIGLILIILEVLVIPGVTAFGFIGFLSLILGIASSYVMLGPEAGNISLIATIGLLLGIIIMGYRSMPSKKMALNHKLSSSFTQDINPIKVGDAGTSLGDLRPWGRAIINNITYNVCTTGNYISDGTEIIIDSIEKNKILVREK